MLETIREYAAERLEQRGDAAQTRQAHARYFLELAERAEPELRGAKQLEWYGRLESEHDNLRAALAWALDSGAVEIGLRVASAIWWFWFSLGYLAEGRTWLDRLLAQGGEVSRVVRAKALVRAGVLTWGQAEMERALALLDEGLALSREQGHKEYTANALNALGLVRVDQGEYAQAVALYEESLALYRDLGNVWGMANLLNELGDMAHHHGEDARAEALLEQSLALYRELGDKWGIGNVLHNLGVLARDQGENARAVVLFEESLAFYRALSEKWGIGNVLHSLGILARDQGEDTRAVALLEESLALRRELGDKRSIAECLEGLAGVACRQGQPERAVLLYAAASASRQSQGTPLPPNERGAYDRLLDTTREALGEEAFAAVWTRGGAMTLEQAMAYALSAPVSDRQVPS